MHVRRTGGENKRWKAKEDGKIRVGSVRWRLEGILGDILGGINTHNADLVVGLVRASRQASSGANKSTQKGQVS